MRSRPTTKADIDAILSKPSAITAAEIAASGLGVDEWRYRMAAALEDGAGTTVETLERNPLFVFIHRERGRPGLRTMTAASVELYWELGAAAAVITRHAAAEMFRAFPGATFRCTTRSPHPDTARWFRAMGFTEIDPNIFEGGFNV